MSISEHPPATPHPSTRVEGTPVATGRAHEQVAQALHSGAPLFTFDREQRIRSWNAAAEGVTGTRADDVVGRHCWEALCARDEAGGLVCHSGCSFHRLLRENWPVRPSLLTIRTAAGPRRMLVPMITLHPRSLFAALLLEPPQERRPGRSETAPPLTPRQQEVLALIADGKPARAIATELRLSEMTVRNHIRSILRSLGCTSQLSAVAKARRLGLV